MTEGETEKVVFHSSLPRFLLSAMHEVVGEAVLPNNFFKAAQLHKKKAAHETVFPKKHLHW